MSGQIFDFPYHKYAMAYPNRRPGVKLGGNWSYTSKPNTPVTRTFKLLFPLFKWFFLEGGVPDLTTEPDINLGRLQKFYEDHEMWDSFLYEHPTQGVVAVKFKAPLEIPEGTSNGNGAVLGITLEFEEISIT